MIPVLKKGLELGLNPGETSVTGCKSGGEKSQQRVSKSSPYKVYRGFHTFDTCLPSLRHKKAARLHASSRRDLQRLQIETHHLVLALDPVFVPYVVAKWMMFYLDHGTLAVQFHQTHPTQPKVHVKFMPEAFRDGSRMWTPVKSKTLTKRGEKRSPKTDLTRSQNS